jgi:hypothetical protein
MENREIAPDKSIYRSVAIGFAQPTWSAVPDSGVSHILFKQSDSHVLHNMRYSALHEAPCAVLKAANNAELTASGKGTLSIAGLNLPAYIFPDHELATNLLGLVPFCDQGCTAVLKKNTFRLLWPNQRAPILTGTRRPDHSLWQVRMGTLAEPDHIPPPNPNATNGLYVEANFAATEDNASYVRFVHAALGYPAPKTFLTAVTKGFITGPGQYTRLTTKMVRKHMPNALATARGHLGKSRAQQLHKDSQTVSALQRFHNRQSRRSKLAIKSDPFSMSKPEPFVYAAVKKTTTLLHLDYTGNLPETGSSGTRLFMIIAGASTFISSP